MQPGKAIKTAAVVNQLTMLRMRFYRFRRSKGYGDTAAWIPGGVLRKLLLAWHHVVAVGLAGDNANAARRPG